MTYTLDTPLSTLLNQPQAKQVLDKHFPGVSSNPMLMMAGGLTINQILAMPQATQMGLTKEKAQMFLDEVNKIV